MAAQVYPLDCLIMIDNTVIHILQVSRGFIEQVPSHSHGAGDYEIHYLTSGRGYAVVRGQRYEVSGGTLYVTGPFVEHAQYSADQEPLFEYCINLQAEEGTSGKKGALSVEFLETFVWYGMDGQNLLSLFQQIFGELEEKRTGWQYQLQALFTQCIIAMIRNYMAAASGKTPGKEESFGAAKSAVSDKAILAERYFLFSYGHLSLNELAGVLGFSTRQTQRFLQVHYGKTFRQKKEESRMEAAKLLLAASGESITSVSEKLGFASVEYFSASFRKYCRVSPRAYRKAAGRADYPQSYPQSN